MDQGVEVSVPVVIEGRRAGVLPSLADLARGLAAGSGCFCCGFPLQPGAPDSVRGDGPYGCLSCPLCGAEVKMYAEAGLPEDGLGPTGLVLAAA